MWLGDGLLPRLWPLGKVCVNQRSRTMYLFSILFLTYIFICRGEVDHRIWKSSPSGVFSTNFFMRSFEMMREVKYSTSLVWVGLAPSRVEALCHLAISRKVSKERHFDRRHLYVHFAGRRGRRLNIYFFIVITLVFCGVTFLLSVVSLGAW